MTTASTTRARKVAQRWKTHQRSGFIDSAALLADIWESKTDREIQKLMSDQAIELLRHDKLGVTGKTGRTTMCAYHTYVGNMVRKKFGSSSICIERGKPSFRGLKDDPDIKDYARSVMRITVDRVLYCL